MIGGLKSISQHEKARIGRTGSYICLFYWYRYQKGLRGPKNTYVRLFEVSRSIPRSFLSYQGSRALERKRTQIPKVGPGEKDAAVVGLEIHWEISSFSHACMYTQRTLNLCYCNISKNLGTAERPELPYSHVQNFNAHRKILRCFSTSVVQVWIFMHCIKRFTAAPGNLRN